MTPAFEISGLGLVVFLTLAVVLFSLMSFVRRALRAVPMSRSRRRRIERALPAAEALVGLVFLLSGVSLVFRDHPQYTPIVMAALIAWLAWLARFAAHDLVAGLIVRAGHRLSPGDEIEVDGQRGRIHSLGYRTLTLETTSGDTAIMPYSRLGQGPLVHRSEGTHEHRHSFSVALPADLPAARGVEVMRRAALLSHWSSVARSPDVRLTDSGRAEVSVFSLDRTRGPEIEASVRDALAAIDED